MNWENNLIELFNDPLLDNVYPLPPRLTPNDHLSTSFLEILDWVEENGREPFNNAKDFKERSLMSRLHGIRNNDEKRIYLKPLDRCNLL